MKRGGKPTHRTAIYQRDYTEHQAKILRAAQAYKDEHGMKFLSILDMANVLEGLGWKSPD